MYRDHKEIFNNLRQMQDQLWQDSMSSFPGAAFPRDFTRLLLILALLGFAVVAQAMDSDFDPEPLRPPDTSSPRDTLRSFLANADKATEEGHRGMDAPQTYRAFRRAMDALDFTTTPEGNSWFVRSMRVALLQEVLARIELPPEEQIPGAEEVADGTATHWTIPNTRIRIERIEQGPQTGEFLFSADTVAKVDRIYRRTQHLPYKPGASGGIYEELLRADDTPQALARKLHNRLKPVDTSNPRATLEGFLDSVNRAYVLVMDANNALRAIPPAMTREEAKEVERMAGQLVERATIALDLGQIPEALRGAAGKEAALHS